MGRYAIVGFGCAGYNAAKELRRLQPEAHIDVYSNTADAPANPMLTTYYVCGKITREEVFPLGDKEGIIRVSVSETNTIEECDFFLEKLKYLTDKLTDYKRI